MPTVTAANGTHLCYETCGDPAHPPMLLIQGLSGQLIGWRPEVCQAFVEAGYHVIRFDNRDVGGSQKFPGASYGIPDMADDAAGLLKALGIPAAHVTGQSMGGMIAQELAIRHPRKVLSLALVYTAASGDWLLSDALDRPTQIPVVDRQSAIQGYLVNESSCASPAYAQDTAWIADLGGQMYDRDPEQSGVVRQMNAVLTSRDRSELVATITAPTTILVGDGDRLIDPAASEDLHRRIPGSELHVFAGMGHEVPLAILRKIVDIIDRNATRSSSTVAA
jgi:pimeloyl-ACP methyl ester carboxylesterase